MSMPDATRSAPAHPGVPSPGGPRPDRLPPGGFEPSPVVGPLLSAVPEFGPSYLALVAGCEDDPGEPVILMELAEFLTGRLTVLHRTGPLVDRILAVIEGHLETLDDDPVGCDLVAFAFFDSLSPEERSRLLPSLRPRARELSLALDLPDADWEVLS